MEVGNEGDCADGGVGRVDGGGEDGGEGGEEGVCCLKINKQDNYDLLSY